LTVQGSSHSEKACFREATGTGPRSTQEPKTGLRGYTSEGKMDDPGTEPVFFSNVHSWRKKGRSTKGLKLNSARAKPG
jgi:hypothetical protein